ncbi:hypothetical protein TRM7557_00761 [Tritonibacter multivorans]|uniref:Immunity MXAN-0049 protein domain-containing protein n=1 Tax=Tritonibacter multivorans TaxID=928856 RepID=A0A0P1G3E4_9RHOB|nr:DUF1629 domain-containing protein [Tritonibacter multivorans]MDA7419798.1 hypothetical protein [Tritonibacter multivorans]CUH76197.1 hypothetical protein TRM7557_00761 [Tritonibacter multivorans]SFC53464.1 hypothetical protein SAMN04488049_10319 [Tritonibacter multivorans]
MTYVFCPPGQGNVRATDMPEWRKRYPVPSEHKPNGADLSAVFMYGERRLLSEEVPKRLIAKHPRRIWPDAFLATGSLYVVREAIAEIIDTLDPARHQFFPLRLETPYGNAIAGPWFAMNVFARQDSVVMEKSCVYQSKDHPEELCSFFHDGEDRVTVDPDRQTGLHLWRERRFQGSLLGSDTLMEKLAAKELGFFPNAFRAFDLETRVF